MSVAFLKAMGERALKTVAQSLLSSILAYGAFSLADVGWAATLSAAGMAGLISVLTSIVSARLAGDPDSPSLVAGDSH